MFLPHDLTTAERELVDSVTRQLLAHRMPPSADDEQAVRHEATQIAAEMIFEARAVRTSTAPESDEDVTVPATGYHRRLMTMAETDQQIRERQAAERDQSDERDQTDQVDPGRKESAGDS